ncbi:MAG: DUF2911 domain-containing protein [Terrimonas ferruginea]|uniref:DUF2911 domain-containing protein n=1 Tax=Terrimonas ferruginea TaxID=249 RepID=UPI000AFD71C5|nr:DUF2911 domain-containing protein [Terrimonas ferruginea]MBN8783423.1 DUF2911 domain-containing protein [Terrimonas ferruginea]
MIKQLFLSFVMAGAVLTAAAQTAMPPADKSPLDISYYPADYPMLKIQGKVTESPIARVVYSRPSKSGRKVYGGLVEYGKVWRLGANEATEIEFYRNVKINGKTVPKGRYTLYAIVEENQWNFIINKDTDCWGAFKYDEKKDVVRMQVPARTVTNTEELVSMVFEKTTTGFNLVVAWDNVQAALPITL